MWVFDALRPFLPFFAIALTVIGVAWGIFVWRRDNQRLLTVCQTGTSVENVVMAREDGVTTAIMLNAVIVNDSPKATIVIRHFDVELPWDDPEFDWLPDPAEMAPPRSEYGYSRMLVYGRDMVLNHRRYEQGKLSPGEAIRGLLMGRSMVVIPADFEHGQSIHVRLTVYDTKGKKYSAPFELRVDRRMQIIGIRRQ